MTTHDRDKVIAAAKEAGIGWAFDIGGMEDFLFAFYTIAYEAGKIAGVREYTTAKLAAQGITCYGGDNEALFAR